MENLIPSFNHSTQSSSAYKLFLGTTTAALAGTLNFANITIDHNLNFSLSEIPQHNLVYAINKDSGSATYSPHNHNKNGNSDLESFQQIVQFTHNIMTNSITLDPIIGKIIDENFMDLLA